MHCDPRSARSFAYYAEVDGAGAGVVAEAGAGAGVLVVPVESLDVEPALDPGGVVAELPPLESVL